MGFVFETESCPLCSEFSTGLYAYKLHADAFPIPFNFFSDRTRCDFVLSLHANTGISPNQKQHEHTKSARFSSGVLAWVVKTIKEITLAEKILKNSQNLWLESLSSGSFMKEVTKSLFSFPVY